MYVNIRFLMQSVQPQLCFSTTEISLRRSIRKFGKNCLNAVSNFIPSAENVCKNNPKKFCFEVSGAYKYRKYITVWLKSVHAMPSTGSFCHTRQLPDLHRLVASWLRHPPCESQTWGSIPTCARIFPGLVIPVTQNWHPSGYPARSLALKDQH